MVSGCNVPNNYPIRLSSLYSTLPRRDIRLRLGIRISTLLFVKLTTLCNGLEHFRDLCQTSSSNITIHLTLCDCRVSEVECGWGHLDWIMGDGLSSDDSHILSRIKTSYKYYIELCYINIYCFDCEVLWFICCIIKMYHWFLLELNKNIYFKCIIQS